MRRRSFLRTLCGAVAAAAMACGFPRVASAVFVQPRELRMRAWLRGGTGVAHFPPEHMRAYEKAMWACGRDDIALSTEPYEELWEVEPSVGCSLHLTSGEWHDLTDFYTELAKHITLPSLVCAELKYPAESDAWLDGQPLFRMKKLPDGSVRITQDKIRAAIPLANATEYSTRPDGTVYCNHNL